MVAYTIVTKWWWKKLVEEIEWELMSAHSETAVSRYHQESYDAAPESSRRDQ